MIYSSSTNKYNALDQTTRIRQYVGGAPSQEPETEGSGYQTTTMTYDGYADWKRSTCLNKTPAPRQLTLTTTTTRSNSYRRARR